jgi:hypothetical protein
MNSDFISHLDEQGEESDLSEEGKLEVTLDKLSEATTIKLKRFVF